MDTVKVNLAAMNEKLDRSEKNVLEKIETNGKAVENVVGKVELVQEQLNKQEESNRRLEADNVEMKKSLHEITKQLERMTRQTPHEVQAEEMKKGIAEADGLDREPMVVIAGGANTKSLNSVEMFSLLTRTWTLLQPMKEGHEGASSVVYNNQLFVVGGYVKSMEKLCLNAVQADQSIPWENVPAELPGELAGQRSVVYNGRLIVIGGYDADKHASSDSITEISLVPPYTSKRLATMPQTRCYHGAAIFGDKILILGGCGSNSFFRNVVMYDITKNECQELAPLPYPMREMVTVKWGDDNVMIMGGVDSKSETLNKALMYNIKTQKSHMLPDMKYKRKRCAAAVVRDTVIVMGGQDESGNILNSVESFRFDTYNWEKLPQMHVARCRATATVC
jgi:N-acetylneuraminic acid mutarotase